MVRRLRRDIQWGHLLRHISCLLRNLALMMDVSKIRLIAAKRCRLDLRRQVAESRALRHTLEVLPKAL